MRLVLLALLSLVLSSNVLAAEELSVPAASSASESTISEQNTPMKVVIPESKSESEIAVNLESKSTNVDSTSLGQKVLLVFSILGVLVLTTWMFGRKYLKKGAILAQSHQIKILSQASLGPKKSLAVIRVAGESVLIGITDTQVSLIKSLSLLDEDLPEQTPLRFESTLRQAEGANGPIENDSFSFSNLKFQVSNKLQSMKVID